MLLRYLVWGVIARLFSCDCGVWGLVKTNVQVAFIAVLMITFKWCVDSIIKCLVMLILLADGVLLFDHSGKASSVRFRRFNFVLRSIAINFWKSNMPDWLYLATTFVLPLLNQLLTLSVDILIAQISAPKRTSPRILAHFHHSLGSLLIIPVLRWWNEITHKEIFDISIWTVDRVRTPSLIHYLLHDLREVSLGAFVPIWFLSVLTRRTNYRNLVVELTISYIKAFVVWLVLCCFQAWATLRVALYYIVWANGFLKRYLLVLLVRRQLKCVVGEFNWRANMNFAFRRWFCAQ